MHNKGMRIEQIFLVHQNKSTSSEIMLKAFQQYLTKFEPKWRQLSNNQIGLESLQLIVLYPQNSTSEIIYFCAKQRQFFDASIRFKVTEPGGSRFTVHCRRRRAAATSPVAHPMHKARPNGTILKKERKCRQCSVLHNGDKTFLVDCCKVKVS